MKIIYKLSLVLSFLGASIILLSCEESIELEPYNGNVLRSYDLRGKVKSVTTETEYLNPTQFISQCSGNVDSENKISKYVIAFFDSTGNKVKTRYSNDLDGLHIGGESLYYYNGQNQLVKVNNIDSEGEIIHTANYHTYPNSYWTLTNNVYYTVDTINKRMNTDVLTREGKLWGPFEVKDKMGNTVEYLEHNIQYPHFKYYYNDSLLTHKVEHYQGLFIDSLEFIYNSRGNVIDTKYWSRDHRISKTSEGIKCPIRLVYDNYDINGNWTELLIVVDDQETLVKRTIEYY
ncbi:hypothetical protein H8S95_01745 [Pontibacter sp. KCTC 32443]|uniref:hypothetical protein n=1 Tax=Pontibacter TaxID=323449 RepID=UPI00164D613A|nr:MULTISPECIES: hypothetical protein [Pontibacter]MBC5772772.1 hypothetical protein [Pontibacter sp. KCTC 32443]